MAVDAPRIGPPLLGWYDSHGRTLPWRGHDAAQPDPYAVWLSEIMLQQTTVKAVIPYYETFMARWPTVEALAAATLDDVLVAWAGLGYYARARNLHKCAQVVARDYGGVFPTAVKALLALPGIGTYTAAAIAAIAYDQPVTPVDGNIERVISRVFAVTEALTPAVKKQIGVLANAVHPGTRSSAFAQALMDLGAMACTPKSPRCAVCPLMEVCRAYARPDLDPATLPCKPAKRPQPVRHGAVFWITTPNGQVLLRRRPEQGLLGGMMEFPSSDWGDRAPESPHHVAKQIFGNVSALTSAGEVRHTFTHFHLVLTVYTGHIATTIPVDMQPAAPHALTTHALPSVMTKVAKLVRTPQPAYPDDVREKP